MIFLTDAAAARARRFVAAEAGAIGICVRVKRSGCSGYGYVVEVIHAPPADAQLFAHDGFQVAVRTEDLPLLDGLRIDVQKQGLNEMFVFDNPQAQVTCGCGNSFNVS